MMDPILHICLMYTINIILRVLAISTGVEISDYISSDNFALLINFVFHLANVMMLSISEHSLESGDAITAHSLQIIGLMKDLYYASQESLANGQVSPEQYDAFIANQQQARDAIDTLDIAIGETIGRPMSNNR